jgi:hypothetical protein
MYQLGERIFADSGKEFYIPSDQPQSMEAASQDSYAALMSVIFRYTNEFFPKGSWPWTAAREAVFVLGGKGKYTQAELQRIYESDATGPLGFLAIANLLTYINHPAVTVYAQRGQERLSATDFRKDANLLLAGESVFSNSIGRLVRAIQSLSDEDVAAIAAVMAPNTAELLRESVAVLRENKDVSSNETLLPILDKYWSDYLKNEVEIQLKRFLQKQSKL